MPNKDQEMSPTQKQAKCDWWRGEQGQKIKEKWKKIKEEKLKNDIEQYNKNPSVCLYCHNILSFNLFKSHRKFCNKSCSCSYNNIERNQNGFVQDYKKVSETLKRHHQDGTIKINKTGVIINCKMCGKEKYIPKCFIGKKIYCSKKCYLEDDNKKIGENSGGYRKNSGRGKCGWYRGYWCQSSYELAFVIYHIDHNILFTRNTEGFEYIFNNNKYKFYPDFIINNEYYEIKGFMTTQQQEKINQFPHIIHLLTKKELSYIFEYVENKYGKDFIKLYEGNPHNQKNNNCKICGEKCKNIYCSQKCSGKSLIQYKNI